jgi:hypothetical protein
MAYGEGDPQINPDAVLDGFAVDDLRAEVLNIAANRLWRADFFNDALPGEHLEFARTIMTPQGLRRGAVYLDCDLDQDVDDEDEPEKVHGIHIRYEVPEHGLTDSLFEVAVKDIIEPKEREEFENNYRDGVVAWRVYCYNFETQASMESVDAARYHELQERDASAVWDDRSLPGMQVDTDDEAQRVLITTDSMDIQLETERSHLTVGDRVNILATLALLNIIEVELTESGYVEVDIV